jgi:hypothetical protein
MKLVLILILALCVAGCDRPAQRYEIVKMEIGAIRLDRTTGEMVSISSNHSVYRIELLDESEDPELGRLKSYPGFPLPGSKRGISLAVTTRWQRGYMEYKVVASPFQADVPIHADGSKLTLYFGDNEGFEVTSIDIDFSDFVQHERTSDWKCWELQGSERMNKATYARLQSFAKYRCHYAPALKAALESKP